METNERLKMTLLQETEAELVKLLAQVYTLKDGDLKNLEQQVMQASLTIGRKVLEGIVQAQSSVADVPAHREGGCGHEQRLVGVRPKQVLTLLGKITVRRPYYQCVRPEQGQTSAGEQACTHGEAPADALWGLQERRTSAAVPQAISYLCASLTLEEAAETFSRLLPLGISARQALSLMQPVGEALARQEEERVAALWKQAAQARTATTSHRQRQPPVIERLYIELAGILARLRRGSVPLEGQERKRPGDVYRAVKVGAVFGGKRGPHRSALVPGVFVDQAGEKRYVARRTTAEEFGKALYMLAVSCGLAQARQVVVLGDGALWIWRLAAEHFPEAVQIVDV